jgi:hypothetical protein
MQMAPRRRNPKGGRRFAGAWQRDPLVISMVRGEERQVQSAGRDARIHFQAAC